MKTTQRLLPPPQKDPTLWDLVAAGTARSTTVIPRLLLTLYLFLTNESSDAFAEVLFLRLYDLRLLPYHEYIHHPPPHAIGSRIRNLPPPDTTILPIDTSRTAPHYTANCHTHPLGISSAHSQAQCESRPVWRSQPVHISPLKPRAQDMAQHVVVQSVWLHLDTTGTGAFVCQ